MIPKLHYISKGNTSKEHLENIQKACSSGIELVQLDMKHISKKSHLKLAEDAKAITSHFQTRLIITSNYKVAVAMKADGVYLENNDASPAVAREHLYAWQTIGATAHTLQDCEKMITKEIDYIGLGPFRTSTSNDDKALGVNGFIAIADALATETPLIGFGGITTNDVDDILKSGISGIAVSNAITADFNSIKTFNHMLKASATEEQRHSFEKK